MSKTETYDLSRSIADFCVEVVRVCEELQHIDTSRVLVGLTMARKRTSYGTYATCLPLRFKDGASEEVIRGVTWRWPPVVIANVEMLYYLTFLIPRFLDTNPRDRIETVIHELFHISPSFNGDLRRFPGYANEYHGPSLKWYSALLQPMVRVVKRDVDLSRYDFLQLSYEQLSQKYERVTGVQLRISPVRVGKAGRR